MADRPNAPAQVFAAVQSGATSPVIYADGVAAFGLTSGVVQIELFSIFLTPTLTGTERESMSVAHLRLSMNALAALKDAIQGIEAMLAPADGKPN